METPPSQSELPAGKADDPALKISVPTDICEWVAPGDLLAWVREELAALSPQQPKDSLNTDIFKNPMLSVLAVAYARGIFDPEEISELCRSDSFFKTLAKDVPISATDLMSFRHRDRGFLVKLIRHLLIRAAREKLNLADSTLPKGLERALHLEANERLDTARHFDRGDVA